MAATVTGPSLGVRRHAGVLRVLLAVVIFLASLSLTLFGNPTPARAFVNPATPLVVAGTIRSAAPLLGVAAATGPIGIGLGIAAVGLALYATRDTWLPVLEDAVNGDSESPAQAGSGSCPVTLRPPILSGPDLRVIAERGGGCSGGARGVTVTGTCVTAGAASSVYLLFDDGVSFKENPNYSDHSMTVCPPSGALVQATIEAYGLVTSAGTGVPDSAYEQSATVKCRQPDGSMVTITDSHVGDPGQVWIPSCADRVPGSIPWEATISGGPKGGTKRELQKITTDPEKFEQYGDCFNETGLVCKIRVFVDGNPCKIGDSGPCTSWWGVSLDEPERVECRFGTHVIDLDYCRPLRKAFKPGQGPRTIDTTMPDGSPNWDEAPVPAPQPEPGTETGVTPDTKNPAEVSDPPKTVNPNTSECFGETISLNPVDWVYVPVKCAFIWAFLPRTPLSTRVETIKATVTAKAPFSWFAGFAAVPAAVPGGTCPDWRIKVAGLDRNVVCDSSYTDAVRAARPVLLVFMASLALWPLIRSTAYAAFPVLKPHPGSLR